MKKLLTVLLSILGGIVFAYLALFALGKYLEHELYCPDIKITVSELYNNSSDVTCINKSYYYIYAGEICNLESNKTIYSTSSENAIIKVFLDNFWIIENDTLIELDEKGEVVSSYKVPEGVEDFSISENLAFLAYKVDLRIFDLSKNNNVTEIRPIYDEVFTSDSCQFTLYGSNIDSCICYKFGMTDSNYRDTFVVIDKDGNCVLSDSGYIHMLYLDRDGIIYMCLDNIYEYSFTSGDEKTYFAKYEEGFNFFNVMPFCISDNDAILIGQETTSRSLFVRNGGPVSTTDNMAEHKSDCLFVVDINNLDNQSFYKTKTFERIIFADSKKCVTYYEGKYLIYSLDDWKIENEQSADEIKEGSGYVFDSCGNYIFVFDADTGDLLNTIDIE